MYLKSLFLSVRLGEYLKSKISFAESQVPIFLSIAAVAKAGRAKSMSSYSDSYEGSLARALIS